MVKSKHWEVQDTPPSTVFRPLSSLIKKQGLTNERPCFFIDFYIGCIANLIYISLLFFIDYSAFASNT